MNTGAGPRPPLSALSSSCLYSTLAVNPYNRAFEWLSNLCPLPPHYSVRASNSCCISACSLCFPFCYPSPPIQCLRSRLPRSRARQSRRALSAPSLAAIRVASAERSASSYFIVAHTTDDALTQPYRSATNRPMTKVIARHACGCASNVSDSVLSDLSGSEYVLLGSPPILYLRHTGSLARRPYSRQDQDLSRCPGHDQRPLRCLCPSCRRGDHSAAHWPRGIQFFVREPAVPTATFSRVRGLHPPHYIQRP